MTLQVRTSSRNVSELSTDLNITAVGGASFDPVLDGAGNDTSVVTSTALRVWNEPSDEIPTGGAGGGAGRVPTTPRRYIRLGTR